MKCICEGGGHYDKVYESFHGWLSYAEHAKTYKLRMKICKSIEDYFPNEISSMEIDRWLNSFTNMSLFSIEATR